MAQPGLWISSPLSPLSLLSSLCLPSPPRVLLDLNSDWGLAQLVSLSLSLAVSVHLSHDQPLPSVLVSLSLPCFLWCLLENPPPFSLSLVWSLLVSATRTNLPQPTPLNKEAKAANGKHVILPCAWSTVKGALVPAQPHSPCHIPSPHSTPPPPRMNGHSCMFPSYLLGGWHLSTEEYQDREALRAPAP